MDLITGERNGYLSLFRRTITGELTNAGRIKSNGLEIRTNNNSWPYVCDWNEDGKKDLLVGQEGIGAPCNVFVYINQGTNSEPVFNDSTPVLRNGSPFRDYRTIPVTLDLDHDGKKDLILGEWYSSVRFYQNQGTNSNPVFTSFINFVAPDPDSFLNGNPPRINFTDWDGDTDLDMITCDYYGSIFLRRNITPININEPNHHLSVVREFDITPNPVNQDFVTLRYNLSNPELLRIRIYDVTGRTIISQNLKVNHEASSINLDLSHLKAGIYLLKIETNNWSKTHKLVKTRYNF